MKLFQTINNMKNQNMVIKGNEICVMLVTLMNHLVKNIIKKFYYLLFDNCNLCSILYFYFYTAINAISWIA